MNLWLIFLTGLTTGGISCVAMQGGLLASTIANQKIKKPILQVGSFLIAKLIAYSILGALLGFIGTAFQLNLTTLLIFQSLTALYLIASALNLLNVHPIFRMVVIQPPKFLFKTLKKSSNSADWFGPALLGSLTVLVPCGVTQAMEVNAISSGSPLSGALIMFAFVLGTMPVFALIGMATASIPTLWTNRLNKVAAALLIILSISSINGVLTVLNAPISLQSFMNTVQKYQQFESGKVQGAATALVVEGTQKVAIDITPQGYQPNLLQVKKGIPVELTLTTKDNYTCANYFVFKAFNISARMQPSETQVFRFVPEKTGKFTFSCSMGMYAGVMEVI
jgi:sulfite exporter TauE/SafE